MQTSAIHNIHCSISCRFHQCPVQRREPEFIWWFGHVRKFLCSYTYHFGKRKFTLSKHKIRGRTSHARVHDIHGWIAFDEDQSFVRWPVPIAKRNRQHIWLRQSFYVAKTKSTRDKNQICQR